MALVMVGCSDSEGSEDQGQSDIIATGSVQYGSGTKQINALLVRTACERLGWLGFRGSDNEAVLVFDPGAEGLTVGVHTMQPVDDGRPIGWLNCHGLPSLLTVEGTTLITNVTESEIRGSVVWIAMALGQEPPDTSWGTVEVRGTFRAVHVSGDDVC